jgi:hypothetical protein
VIGRLSSSPPRRSARTPPGGCRPRALFTPHRQWKEPCSPASSGLASRRRIRSGHHLDGSGDLTITDLPEGVCYLLAVALPKCTDSLVCLLPERELMLVCAVKEVVVVDGGVSRGHVSLTLRRMQVTDSPLLILLPLLLGGGQRKADIIKHQPTAHG